MPSIKIRRLLYILQCLSYLIPLIIENNIGLKFPGLVYILILGRAYYIFFFFSNINLIHKDKGIPKAITMLILSRASLASALKLGSLSAKTISIITNAVEKAMVMGNLL